MDFFVHMVVGPLLCAGGVTALVAYVFWPRKEPAQEKES